MELGFVIVFLLALEAALLVVPWLSFTFSYLVLSLLSMAMLDCSVAKGIGRSSELPVAFLSFPVFFFYVRIDTCCCFD